MVLKTADSITYNPIVVVLPKKMLPPNHVVSVQPQIVCCRFPDFEKARDYVLALGVTTRIQWAALVQAHSLPDYVPSNPYYGAPHGFKDDDWVSWNHWFGKENPTDNLGDLADAVTKVESKKEKTALENKNRGS